MTRSKGRDNPDAAVKGVGWNDIFSLTPILGSVVHSIQERYKVVGVDAQITHFKLIHGYVHILSNSTLSSMVFCKPYDVVCCTGSPMAPNQIDLLSNSL